MAGTCHPTRGHPPNGRQLSSLLRTRRKRPRHRAADQRDELAAPDHSITSSAQSLVLCWSPKLRKPSNREHTTLGLLCEIVHPNGPKPSDQPMRLATSDLMERPLVLSHELANFSCKRSKDFLSLGLFRLSGAIRQLLLNSEVWWFKPAQPQLCCQVIHHSFFRVIFVSKPASDCSDPVVGQLWNIERGEAPAARQVVLRLLQALVLQECIDNQLGIFSRIISHLIHLCSPISRSLVA